MLRVCGDSFGPQGARGRGALCFWSYGGCYTEYFFPKTALGHHPSAGPSANADGRVNWCARRRLQLLVPPWHLWRAQDHPQKRSVPRSARPRPPAAQPRYHRLHTEPTYAVHPCPEACTDAPRRGVFIETKHGFVYFRGLGPPWLSPGLRTRLCTSVCTRMWISRSDRPEARARVRVATGASGPIQYALRPCSHPPA